MGMKKPEDGGQTVVSALLSTEPGYHSLLWYSAPADTKHGTAHLLNASRCGTTHPAVLILYLPVLGTAGSTVVMGCGRL